jgi:thiol:disulfide interchange protein DsbA
MKRRDFSLAAGSLVLLPLGAAPAHAHAQGQGQGQGQAPRAGTDYLVLGKRVPVDAPAGKVEVIEFFSYNCPHCGKLELLLEPWLKMLPKDVAFRRVPVPFLGSDAEAKQRLYYTLEALGKVDDYQLKVFDAVRTQRQAVSGDANIVAWAAANGLDGAKFKDAFNAFGVAGKARRAAQLSEIYKVAAAPALALAGRWYVDGQLAGSLAKMLQVAAYLVGEARKG